MFTELDECFKKVWSALPVDATIDRVKILEQKAGYYILAQDGDRYYLGMPDDFTIKLKPREVKDYLKWGTKALDELSRNLSNQDAKLKARNLAGVDLLYALRRYRSEQRTGEAPVEDEQPMTVVARNAKEQWMFFTNGPRYFMEVRWSSGMADGLFIVELVPEEIAAYKAFGEAWPGEFARRLQNTGGSDPEFKRNMTMYNEQRSDGEVAEIIRLLDEMKTASWEDLAKAAERG